MTLPEQICADTFQKNQLLFDLELIRSSTRKSETVMHRKICAMALHQAGYSYWRIANFLNRTHASIYQLVNRTPFYGKWLAIRIPDTDTHTRSKVSLEWCRKEKMIPFQSSYQCS